MDYLNKIKGWAKGIADVGVSFIALGIVFRSRFDRTSSSLDFISYLQQKII